MKTIKIVVTLVLMIIGMSAGMAQTKKTTSTKKTTTTKKAAPKAIAVYICTSEKDKLFHKRRTCAGLNKCSGEIKYITSVAELKKWKRKSCIRCNN
jgi:hypothetical protein